MVDLYTIHLLHILTLLNSIMSIYIDFNFNIGNILLNIDSF